VTCPVADYDACQDDIMLEYASLRPKPRGLPFHTFHGLEPCAPYCCRREIRHRNQFLLSSYVADLAVYFEAYREKDLQEWLLEETDSLPYCPTLPCVCLNLGSFGWWRLRRRTWEGASNMINQSLTNKQGSSLEGIAPCKCLDLFMVRNNRL
jgi:hypothetical protein